ncbi:hypothetical protein GBZ86_16650 [Clostridium tarantellae]|uniref:Type II secretion system protein GspF domain-containing protein n=1 Tax=Clostridium tarantellae TaxID=39493 RepID=A0A6I1MRK7_9CLOT|nr:hypothetical protein [Clostridium tarantellae]
MISSGISVRKALDLLVNTITCPITKKYFIYIKRSLWQGQSLSEVISNIDIMSSLTNMFIFSGEESGRLENNIKTLSHMLDEEFLNEINSIKGKIQPITMLILGIMVFLMALMIFVPMYGYMNYA